MRRTLNKIEQLYSKNLEEYGMNPKAVGWNTEEGQVLRFEKLNKVIADVDKNLSFNDYGCGYGSHLSYLVNSGIKVSCYNGYDLSSEMIENAKFIQNRHNIKLKLQVLDKINTFADYTFVSGTFNVKFDISDEAWNKFIQEKLKEISNYSNIGFAFNLLTSDVDWKEDHLYYADPLFWFDFCRNNISKKVTLLHDYPLWEWTICVTK